MKNHRDRIAFLLSFLTFEAALVTDPVRPWLPFSLWTCDAGALSASGILAFAGLVLLGSLVPFPFPGLGPLPATFPLIVACLLVYGLPPAAALAAGTILLASRRRDEEAPAAWAPEGAAWPSTLGASGLGLVVASLSGYVLPEEPASRGSMDLGVAVTTALILSAAIALAALGARYLAGRRPDEKAPPAAERMATIAASAVAAGLALAAAQAVRVWGLGPVALWLAPPFAVMAPLAVALSRQRGAADIERRRAEGLAEIIEAIALAIEAKDRVSARHLRRMRAFAAGIGRRLGLSAEELSHLDLAALLHDVGKLAVPEWILSKPGRLTPDEFQKMTLHAETGAGILEAVPFARGVAPIVRHHHEHYDGSGYPTGLSGLSIPLGARILAVVDAVDSITSERAYRLAAGRQEALDFIKEKSGTLYDPRVVKTLLESFRALEAEADALSRRAAGRGEGARREPAEAEGPPAPAPRIQEVLDTIASSHMETYSLHEIGQALGKALNLNESLSLIAGRLGRLFHFTTCAVWVLDRERGCLVPRLAAGRGAESIQTLTLPVGAGLSGWAAKERRSLISSPPADPILKRAARTDFEALAGNAEVADLASCLVAPLMADQEVVGVVALYDTAGNAYTPAEERLLSMIGRQVGQAVRNGLLFERTQEHTLTDALTGLPNTRYMFVAMDQELVKARDTGSLLSILVMDLDGFGQVNDEAGHPAGDRYLIGVSKVIRGQMRDQDTCVRYSGDEFVAILPGVAREEAAQVAERIRRAVEEWSSEGIGGRRVRLTISVGHATFSLDGEKFEEMIAAADERLGREKLKKKARSLAGAALLPFRRSKQPPHKN